MNIFKSILVIVSLISLSLFTAAPQAHACSCVAPVTPAESLAGARAVFSGTVLSIESDPVSHKVTLDVDEAWKGISESSVVITTGFDSASCGFNFVVGEKYLVYAYGEDGEENLNTTLCSRTHLLVENDPDVVALGAPMATPAPVDSPDLSGEESSRAVHPAVIGVGLVALGIIIYTTVLSRKKGDN